MSEFKPGMYAMPMAEYLEVPAVSAGLLKAVVNECPQAAWFESWMNPNRVADNTKASDAGSIAHEILLEGSEAGVQVFDPAEYPNAKGGGVATGWTNNAIKEARDQARAAGLIPILQDDMTTIRNMVAAARRFIDSLKASEPAVWAAFQDGCGASEQTVLWDDGGTLCRMRPDRISNDRRVIIDVKTTATSVEPADWSRRQMGPLGYWITAAWYRRGAMRCFGVEPAYLFLVVGQNAPHLCSLVGVDPAGFDFGGMQIERGLRLWRECVDKGWWPGYPARACYPEVPAWEFAREQERSGLDPAGIPFDPNVLYGEAA